MAEVSGVSVWKIKTRPWPVVRHENSHTRQSARKVGLNIPAPDPSLPLDEQEESDIA